LIELIAALNRDRGAGSQVFTASAAVDEADSAARAAAGGVGRFEAEQGTAAGDKARSEAGALQFAVALREAYLVCVVNCSAEPRARSWQLRLR
jgi:hypothetical protein